MFSVCYGMVGTGVSFVLWGVVYTIVACLYTVRIQSRYLIGIWTD